MRSSRPLDVRLFRAIGVATILMLSLPMLIPVFAALDPGEFFTFPPTDVSSRWFREFLTDGSWRSSTRLTFAIAAMAAALSSVVGGLAGIAFARLHARVRPLFYPLLVAPLIVPVMILAVSFYGIALEYDLVGNLFAFVVANSLLSAPLVALLVSGVALRMDSRIELASLSCGAGRFRTLVFVTVPMLAPSALAGGALAFLLVLDEVQMSIFLVAPGRTPLAVRMFLAAFQGTTPIVTAASSLLLVSAVVTIGVVTLARNRLAARGTTMAVPGLEE